MTFYIPWPIDWINRYQVKGYNGQNVTIATKVGILYQVNQCIIIIPYLKNQTKNKLLDHIIIITCCQKYFLTTVLFFFILIIIPLSFNIPAIFIFYQLKQYFQHCVLPLLLMSHFTLWCFVFLQLCFSTRSVYVICF